MNEMASGILIAATGVGVFGATVVGLLAISGRLTPEGVKGVPVLNWLLPAGPERKTGDVGASNATAQSDKKQQGTQADQKGKAVAADRIRRKSLFTLQSFAPPTTSQEIQEWYVSTKEGHESLKRDRAALEKWEFELRLREADLEQRRKSVEELMNAVTLAKEELHALRRQFENDITVLKAEEAKNMKRQGTTLAAMEPGKAAEYLVELGPDKETLAVRILVSMEPEAAAEILGAMDVKRGARLIEKAARVLKKK